MSAGQIQIQTQPPITLDTHSCVVSLLSGGASPTAISTLAADQAARLDPPPLRVRAVLTLPDGSLFAGLVQSVQLGTRPFITIED